MFKKIWKKFNIWEIKPFVLKWFPTAGGCVKSNMNSPNPQQMPPLMVRKAAWRR